MDDHHTAQVKGIPVDEPRVVSSIHQLHGQWVQKGL